MTRGSVILTLFILELLGVLRHCGSEGWFGGADIDAVDNCITKLTEEADNSAKATNKAAFCGDLSLYRNLDQKTYNEGWTPAGKTAIANLRACLQNKKAADAFKELFESPATKSNDPNLALVPAMGDFLLARSLYRDDCDREAEAAAEFRFSSSYNQLNEKIMNLYKGIIEKCVGFVVQRSKTPGDESKIDARQRGICAIDPNIPTNQAEKAELSSMKSRIVDTAVCVLSQDSNESADSDAAELVDGTHTAVFAQGLCEAKEKNCAPELFQRDTLCKKLLDHFKTPKSTAKSETSETPKLLTVVKNLFKFKNILSEKAPTAKPVLSTKDELGKTATITKVVPGAANLALKKAAKISAQPGNSKTGGQSNGQAKSESKVASTLKRAVLKQKVAAIIAKSIAES